MNSKKVIFSILLCSILLNTNPSFARIRNQSTKPNITTQDTVKEQPILGLTQTTATSSEKPLYLTLKPYFQSQKNWILKTEISTNVIPQNESHLKNNTHLFGGFYGYSLGSIAFSGNMSLFWGANNNKSSTKGFEGSLALDYFHIDEERQDPEAQMSSSLAYLHSDLSHEILPLQEQAKFWLKAALRTTLFTQTEFNENPSATSLQVSGYYPLSPDFSLGADLFAFSYSAESTDAHSTYNVFQVRSLDFNGQSIPKLISVGAWGTGSWKITRWDRLLGKMGLISVKKPATDPTTPLGANLVLGWEHYWQKNWNLKPSYEITFLHNQTLSGLRINWGFEF